MSFKVAPLPTAPTLTIGDHIKLQRGRTGIVQFIGPTSFSNGREVIGLKLDRYDPSAHDGKGYFSVSDGRGYFTRRNCISNVILCPNCNTSKCTQKQIKQKCDSKLKNKLRRIEILEWKLKSGIVLHTNQIKEMNRKEEYETQLRDIKHNHNQESKTTNCIFNDCLLHPQEISKNVGDAACHGYSHNKISLNKHAISIDIHQRYAKILYSFDFENECTCDRSAELKFEITICADAFISKFVADIDGVIFEGKTKNREEAKQEYETAKQKQENAILISTKARDIPNVFQISTNIDGKSKISLDITIEQYLMKRDSFNELNVQILKTFNKAIITQKFENILFSLNVCDSRGVFDINISPSDDSIAIEHMNMDKLKCCMNGTISCDESADNMNEFVLKYKILGEQSDSTVLFDAETGIFCHVISDLITNQIRGEGDHELKQENTNILIPRRVVFVIDRSGSMSGGKWNKSISSIITTLKQLRHEYDRYSIILFDEEIQMPSTEMIIANKNNISDSIEYLNSKSPNGGTDINIALLKAIQLIDDDSKLFNKRERFYMNQIVLITDGSPNRGVTDTDQIILNVNKANDSGKISIFAFGVGSDYNDSRWINDLNHQFLKVLSVNNNGSYHRIKMSNADRSLKQFCKVLSKPILSNINVKYKEKRNNFVIKNLTCTKFNTLFSGNDIIICGQIRSLNTNQSSFDITATISAITAKQTKDRQTAQLITKPCKIKKKIEINLSANNCDNDINLKNSNIERIWAYLKLKDFAKQKLIYTDMIEYEDDEKKSDESEPLELAMKYKFITPWTSMIVVKEKYKANKHPSNKIKDGRADFSDEQMLGIDLDSWSANANDATVNGKKYFDTSPGKGFFMRKEKYMNLSDIIGVELDPWSANTNGGTVNDTEYFTSNPGRGYFARLQSISDWTIPNELLAQAKELDREQYESDTDNPVFECKNNEEIIAVNIGDRVITMNGYEGTVKFKGGVHFDERELIGMELDQWTPYGHNGIVHGHKYFKCKDGRGIFICQNGIGRNLTDTETVEMKRKSVRNIAIGDRVKLVSGKSGIVKYLGKVDFTHEFMVGIMLDRWSANGNDGRQYFKVSRGRGYFAKKTEIISVEGTCDNENCCDINDVKKEILRIQYELRQIRMLKLKKENGIGINSHQITKITKEKEFMQRLSMLRNQIK